MGSDVVTCPHCGKRNRVPAAGDGSPGAATATPLPWIADGRGRRLRRGRRKVLGAGARRPVGDLVRTVPHGEPGARAARHRTRRPDQARQGRRRRAPTASGSPCRPCRHCSSLTGRSSPGSRAPRRCAAAHWLDQALSADRQGGEVMTYVHADPHLAAIRDVVPPTPQGCEECLRLGTPWVHLRLCLTCGHVGCCDSSPCGTRGARPHGRPPDRAVLRAGRELALVLRPRELCLRTPTRRQQSAARAETPDTFGAYPRLSDEQIATLEAGGTRRRPRRRDAGPRGRAVRRLLRHPVRQGRRHRRGRRGGKRRISASTAPGGSSASWASRRPGRVLHRRSGGARRSTRGADRAGAGPGRPRSGAQRPDPARLPGTPLPADQGPGFRIIGSCYSPDTLRLREFAARNRLPHRWIDLERDKQAERLLPVRCRPQDTPVVIWGPEVLRNPTNTELARRVGLAGPRHGAGRMPGCVRSRRGGRRSGRAGRGGVRRLGRSHHGGHRGDRDRRTGGDLFEDRELSRIPGRDLRRRARRTGRLQAGKFGARIMVSAEITGLDPRAGTICCGSRTAALAAGPSCWPPGRGIAGSPSRGSRLEGTACTTPPPFRRR